MGAQFEVTLCVYRESNRMLRSSLSINGDKDEEEEQGKMLYLLLLIEQAIRFMSTADREGMKEEKTMSHRKFISSLIQDRGLLEV